MLSDWYGVFEDAAALMDEEARIQIRAYQESLSRRAAPDLD